MSAYDHNYDPEFARRLVISLDDVEQSDVIAYEVECGIITRYAKDDRGNVIESQHTGEMMTEDAFG